MAGTSLDVLLACSYVLSQVFPPKCAHLGVLSHVVRDCCRNPLNDHVSDITASHYFVFLSLDILLLCHHNASRLKAITSMVEAIATKGGGHRYQKQRKTLKDERFNLIIIRSILKVIRI